MVNFEIFGLYISLELRISQYLGWSKNLTENQSLWMGRSQGESAFLRGPDYMFSEILANGG